MIRTIQHSMCALLVCTTPIWLVGEFGRAAPTIAERSALHSAERSDLAGLRAGFAPTSPALDQNERESLRAASQANPALGDMRAGDLHLSDRELEIVGITILAVLVLIVIF